MPQITLEYSSNIIEQENFIELFRKCHKILVKNLPTMLEACKSRAYECCTYHIADGASDNAFIHLSVKVLPGRNEVVLQTISELLLELLKEHFVESIESLKLQISVEITETTTTYKKYKNKL